MIGYYRCECHGGDVPHPGPAMHLRVKNHAYPSKRCTRRATVEMRRTSSTNGTAIPAGQAIWFKYCERCAEAIENYPFTDVERRPLV